MFMGIHIGIFTFVGSIGCIASTITFGCVLGIGCIVSIGAYTG